MCLALAAAALGGCGGSGDSGTSPAGASSTVAAPSPRTPSQGSGQPGGKGRAGQGTGEGAAAPGGAQGGGGRKHGPAPALPKSEAGREHAPTAREKAHSAIADMTLLSPSLPMAEGIAAIPAPYTCDGTGRWPALRWGGVPPETRELALYVMSAKPVGGHLFFDWAVGGIDPASQGLEAGALPPGAVVGTNSFGRQGYEICPEPGGAETYVFALFALPTALSPKPGFDPRALREQVLARSGDVGLLTAIYARG